MSSYLVWTLIISGSVSVIGFWAYTLEMLQGRITRFTRWQDLNSWQLELVIMTAGGVIVFLLTLIVGAIIRSYA